MSDFLGVITHEELEALRRARRPGITHPVVCLAFGRERSEHHGAVAHNTQFAARAIMEKDPQWLTRLHPRLVAVDDFTHAASALAEIRAYGALIETWLQVTPAPAVSGSNVSPEFEITDGKDSVIVEVHCKQLDEQQATEIDRNAVDLRREHINAVKAAAPEGVTTKPVVTMKESEIFPTGKPNPKKLGDTVTTNTISRIAAIKQNERQVDADKPFILWLDLQDEGVWGFSIPDQLFSPLYSEGRDGFVGCGAFWFALYGKKDDPLLESRGFDYRWIPLAHEGRFFMTMASHKGKSRVSAVVYSLPHATIVMENPNADRPLPMRIRAALLKLPRFRIDLSLMEWDAGLVARRIEAQRAMLYAAANVLQHYDPLEDQPKST